MSKSGQNIEPTARRKISSRSRVSGSITTAPGRPGDRGAGSQTAKADDGEGGADAGKADRHDHGTVAPDPPQESYDPRAAAGRGGECRQADERHDEDKVVEHE